MVIKPRVYFLSKLILFSCAVHCLFLGVFLLVVRQAGPVKLTISGTATEIDWANVVMMPLVKKVSNAQQKVVTQQAQSKPTATSKQIPAKLATKQVQKKPLPSTIVSAKQEKPTPVKKHEPVLVAKKQEPKKIEVAPKVAQKVPEVSKQPSVTKPTTAAVNPEPEKIYLGRHDKELIVMQQELYTQLAQHWKPPVGLPADVACSVKAVIARDGSVADVLMDSASNILVFDVAARSAIVQTEFPQSVWGKEIIITFNQ